MLWNYFACDKALYTSWWFQISFLGGNIAILTCIFHLGRNCELDYTKSSMFGLIYERSWMYEKLFSLPEFIDSICQLDTHSLIHLGFIIDACRLINEPFMHVHSFPHSVCFMLSLTPALGTDKDQLATNMLKRCFRCILLLLMLWLMILPTSWSFLQDHNLASRCTHG